MAKMDLSVEAKVAAAMGLIRGVTASGATFTIFFISRAEPHSFQDQYPDAFNDIWMIMKPHRIVRTSRGH
jgi:hypothetical protein